MRIDFTFLNLTVLIFIVGIFVIELFTSTASACSWGCLLPQGLVSHPLTQFYRLFTSVFLHYGFFHILFNGLAWYQLAKYLEKYNGTALFFLLFVELLILVPLLCIILSEILDSLSVYLPRWGPFHFSMECTVGISGILFSMIVITVDQMSQESIRLLGLLPIPAQLYPWALFGIIQLFAPGVSLMGHLSGILVGYLYRRPDWKDKLLPHRLQLVRKMDEFFQHRSSIYVLESHSHRSAMPSTDTWRGGQQSLPRYTETTTLRNSRIEGISQPSTYQTSATGNFVPFSGRGRVLGDH